MEACERPTPTLFIKCFTPNSFDKRSLMLDGEGLNSSTPNHYPKFISPYFYDTHRTIGLCAFVYDALSLDRADV